MNILYKLNSVHSSIRCQYCSNTAIAMSTVSFLTFWVI